MTQRCILVVDDSESQRRVIEFWLKEEKHRVITAGDAEGALQLVNENKCDVVISDIKLPGSSGMQLLERLRETMPEVPIILMTAIGAVNDAVAAMKLGAFDYVLKPLNGDAFKVIVQKAIEHRQLVDENIYLRAFTERVSRFENIVGHSKKMVELFELATQVAARDSTVLLLGESGTGKELLAKAIHLNSPRRRGPFVVVNCGAIPATLIESELFGHKKGSFTGAVTDRVGKFEAANHGTIFLDEISELEPELQVRLLRVLQEHEIDKIGETAPVKVDVRVVAATNRLLSKMLEDASFRDDLYYRLSVVTLRVPPLRERRDDIPLLVEHFIEKSCSRYGLPLRRLRPEALEMLTAYNWPGNARELENAIESMVVLSKTEELTTDYLPENVTRQGSRVARIYLDIPDEGISLEEVEKELLLKALEKAEWNQSKAARLLNITRKTLIYRMEKYGLIAPADAVQGFEPEDQE
jgi:two-component system NtrC family response regulator